MGKRPSTLATLEIAPSSLKFVEMLGDEKRVVSAAIFPLEAGRWRDREHLEAKIRLAVASTACGVPARLIASVPLGQAYLRVVETPHFADEAEAHDYLAWDMSRYLARPLESYALDFLPMEKQAEPASATPKDGDRFLSAAFHRDAAAALRDTLEAATGLSLAVLDVDVAGVLNAFAANYPECLPDRSILIQANAHGTAILRTRHGALHRVAFRRDAGNTLHPAAETQERAEGLLRSVRGIGVSLGTAEDGWESPDHVLVCGELSTDADFKELLRTHLPGPFHLLNPFRNVSGPDPARYHGAYPGAPFAAAVGLALRLAEEP